MTPSQLKEKFLRFPSADLRGRSPATCAAEFELFDENEAESFIRGRFLSLGDGGYDPQAALLLAVRPEIDVDQATEILRKGCPPETALRILL